MAWTREAGFLAASQWRIVFVFVSRSEAVEPHSTFCWKGPGVYGGLVAGRKREFGVLIFGKQRGFIEFFRSRIPAFLDVLGRVDQRPGVV